MTTTLSIDDAVDIFNACSGYIRKNNVQMYEFSGPGAWVLIFDDESVALRYPQAGKNLYKPFYVPHNALGAFDISPNFRIRIESGYNPEVIKIFIIKTWLNGVSSTRCMEFTSEL